MAMSAPLGPIDIEGTIHKVTWHPEQMIPAVPMMSGTLGTDRTIPAHYELYFQDVEASDLEAYRGMLFYQMLGNHIVIRHPQDDGYLAVGMRIRICRLQMLGDEGGMTTFYDRVEILPKNPPESIN